MTDPRAVVRHDGNHARYETFKIDASEITYSATAAGGSAQVRLAVALTTDDTVDLCGDGEAVFGKLIAVDSDNFATVQIGGFCTLPAGDGATLTLGRKVVGALNASSAKGYVKTFVASGSYTLAEVALAAATRGLIVNNDTTTAVVVDLG
jgi:hypothetical protein